MAFSDRDIDITRNVRMIEWLKSELVTDLANLFKFMLNGVREEVHDSIAEVLSNMILISYLLGKRLGISYNAVELKMQGKIRLGLLEGHEVEKHYGDLTELTRHLGSSRAGRKNL